MPAHINQDGRFQSDKYPTCPAGKVPLSTRDPAAQDLLWRYAERRRAVDAEFADDLEACLLADGYNGGKPPNVIASPRSFARRPTPPTDGPCAESTGCVLTSGHTACHRDAQGNLLNADDAPPSSRRPAPTDEEG